MQLFRFVIQRTGAKQRGEEAMNVGVTRNAYFAACFLRLAQRAFILTACAFRAAAVQTLPFFAGAGAALAL
jgi:hypothetical protein